MAEGMLSAQDRVRDALATQIVLCQVRQPSASHHHRNHRALTFAHHAPMPHVEQRRLRAAATRHVEVLDAFLPWDVARHLRRRLLLQRAPSRCVVRRAIVWRAYRKERVPRVVLCAHIWVRRTPSAKVVICRETSARFIHV